MKIRDALKETGKAELGGEAYAAKGSDENILYYYNKKTNKQMHPVGYKIILNNDWQPYHEVKEIRPENAGELWKHEDGYYAHTEKSHGVLHFVYFGLTKRIEDVDITNWTRCFPEVEEDVVEEILKDGRGDIIEEGDFVQVNPKDDNWLDLVVSHHGRLILASELRRGETLKLRDMLLGSENPIEKDGNIYQSRVEIGSWDEEDVERIEIEGVKWYQNRDRCIVPEIDSNVADSLLDRPLMKMILEYTKG